MRLALWTVLALFPSIANAQAPAGTAFLDVSVVDRFGAPIEGAAIRLNGPVEREAATDGAGRAAFDQLPDGRYEVDARMSRLLSLGPRVVDLAPFASSSVAFTLKPAGRSSGMISCGGFDPSSLETLGARADLVVHVKVLDRKTVDGATSFSTENAARIVRVFKGVPTDGLVTASTITVHQGGGRIDRGDTIDVSLSNQLPPLTVGDEYVLFLVRSTDRALWILGAEEGTFLVRNGRVKPLGNGGAAATWKDRPADAFFRALTR